MSDISIEAARALDDADPLPTRRHEFAIPIRPDGSEEVYLVGNSLGPRPHRAVERVNEELEAWARLGVRGHTEGEHPWMPYHEFLTEPLARIVGAEPDEVVAMNALTVNLHLMLATFYRPQGRRHRVLVEEHAFPSDHFAVESQIRWHGLDPAESLVTVGPRPGAATLEVADVLDTIERLGDELALVLLPGVQYYTGQVLPLAEITTAAHAVGATVGFDLAHAVGNV
ncbi:MAG: aminotransferase class V-fold PLP-dependent enzyme, partial [Actinomyces sp.]